MDLRVNDQHRGLLLRVLSTLSSCAASRRRRRNQLRLHSRLHRLHTAAAGTSPPTPAGRPPWFIPPLPSGEGGV